VCGEPKRTHHTHGYGYEKERNMSELMIRECPFCGSRKAKATQDTEKDWYVHCEKCCAFCGSAKSKIEAVDQWNRRTTDNDLEHTIRSLAVELSVIKHGVANIMENVDEDGFAYEWCKTVLR